MTLRRHLTATAVALAAVGMAIPAAQAQTFTVSGSVSGAAPTFTYSYVVTPTTGSLGLLIFNFSDPNVTASASAPSGFAALAGPPGAGIFEYFSTIAGGTTTATTFAFTSPDGIGGTLGTSNVSTASGSSGVALVNGTTPAPAPEPGSMASMAVLGACLGLGIVARRRKMLAN